jgi:hypothetical protein
MEYDEQDLSEDYNEGHEPLVDNNDEVCFSNQYAFY